MKKGYTLAEFLIVIVVWAVIIALIAPTINVKIKNSNFKFNAINKHLDYDFTR